MKPENDFLESRKILFTNSALQVGLAAPKKSTEYFYKNADADEVIFVHEGSGTLQTMFGELPFKYGDYVKGEFDIFIKKRGMMFPYVYANHPFDVAGWDGYLYPYTFSIFNFEPLTDVTNYNYGIEKIFDKAEDFLPINGTDYVELYVGNAKQAAHYYKTAFGFQSLAYCGLETGVKDRTSY
eukprot:gene14727-14522_t